MMKPASIKAASVKPRDFFPKRFSNGAPANNVMSPFGFFRASLFAVLFMLVCPASSLAQVDRFRNLGFAVDPWSEAQISFWKKIYTEYTTHDYVLHDSVDLSHIYAVCTSEVEASRTRAKVREVLKGLALKARAKDLDDSKMSDDEKHIFEVMEKAQDAQIYEFAAYPERMRTQLGQKDRLENAYSISTHYIQRMQEMLEEEGVPKVLSALPFVESGFNQNARSSVGATGIWQFMPQTAMRDLRVDSAIDERYDPLKSTRAAAKFLKRNEMQLKNWGLAIMAYNQGAGLVQKAVTRLKTHDPVLIIRLFKDPNFQFASRNYLYEFLAMSDIDAKHELFFKSEDNRKLPSFISVGFPQRLAMKTILSHYKLDEAQIRILNPQFRAPIWSGAATIPAHYPVRLTGITLEEFRKLQYP